MKKSNIKNTALILEGGGMRASYSSGVLNCLLDANIFFKFIAGMSAGSSLAINYMSRDRNRTKDSFTKIVKQKEFGGIVSLLKGNGYFNSNWIYLKTPYKNSFLPYNFESFLKNDSDFRIAAVKKETGELIYWKKDDIKNLEDLVLRVKASSSMPIIMPETIIDGDYYLDGGITGGIAIKAAIEAGFKKFFVIRTRTKGYRKKAPNYIVREFIKKYYKNYGHISDLIINRYKNYNDSVDLINSLEKEGRCYTIYPDKMSLTNRTSNYSKLIEHYNRAYFNTRKEINKIKKYLDII